MNKDLKLDMSSSIMNEEGEYALVLVAICNTEELKEIVNKLKDESTIQATF